MTPKIAMHIRWHPAIGQNKIKLKKRISSWFSDLISNYISSSYIFYLNALELEFLKYHSRVHSWVSIVGIKTNM